MCVLLCSIETYIVSLCANKDIIVNKVKYDNEMSNHIRHKFQTILQTSCHTLDPTVHPFT